ncbi:MAG: peptidoglycan DD-metalloendopeptidase family protein [Treponemataceae bacterium]|nr:peptidoglycan DD-metalloendopeptidase family protein [Treponemataceae bacterium]
MKRRGFFLLFFIISGMFFSLFSIEWPTDNRTIRRCFGMNEGGRFFGGIEFTTENPIYTIDAGEVLFYDNDLYTPIRGFPSPFQNWIAIEHQEGLISIYGKLESFPERTSALIDKGTPLGVPRKRGGSGEGILYFSLYDRKNKQWVHPALLLPSYEDTKAPIIRQVQLVARDGTVPVILGRVKSCKQGAYQIYLDVIDTLDANPSVITLPFTYQCFVNGIEHSRLQVDTLYVKDGKLFMGKQRSLPVDQVYRKDGLMYLGDIQLTRGKVKIEFLVTDLAGNQRTSTFDIVVE